MVLHFDPGYCRGCSDQHTLSLGSAARLAARLQSQGLETPLEIGPPTPSNNDPRRAIGRASPENDRLSDPDGGPMARWPITATSPTIDHLGNLNGIKESAYNLNTGDLRDPKKCQNKYVANLIGWESQD